MKNPIRKFYKTVITTTVLSEDPYEYLGLVNLHHDIVNGDCSGTTNVATSKRLSRKDFVKELQEQGSDPDFFQLDDKGKDID